jgi:hypothetical protein
MSRQRSASVSLIRTAVQKHVAATRRNTSVISAKIDSTCSTVR